MRIPAFTDYLTPEMWETAQAFRGPITALLALVVLCCLVVIAETLDD